MSVIFYKEIGFSKQEIGIFSKGLGWVTTIFLHYLVVFLQLNWEYIKL